MFLIVFSPPFTASNQSALFLKIKGGKYAPISPKLYTQELAIVINRMLQLSVYYILYSIKYVQLILLIWETLDPGSLSRKILVWTVYCDTLVPGDLFRLSGVECLRIIPLLYLFSSLARDQTFLN